MDMQDHQVYYQQKPRILSLTVWRVKGRVGKGLWPGNGRVSRAPRPLAELLLRSRRREMEIRWPLAAEAWHSAFPWALAKRHG